MASLFLFVLLLSPLAPSFCPNEEANLSCVVSGGFCGRCRGRACLFFIMVLVQRGSTKDHGTWSSEHWLGMRHVSETSHAQCWCLSSKINYRADLFFCLHFASGFIFKSVFVLFRLTHELLFLWIQPFKVVQHMSILGWIDFGEMNNSAVLSVPLV